MPAQKTRREERPWPNFGSCFCVLFLLTLSLPYVNWVSQEGCLFYPRSSFRSSDVSLFYFPRLLLSLSFSHCHFELLFPILTVSVQFSSVQSLSRVHLFVTPWITARQASLSITNSRSLLKLMPIESVMPSSHLILCRPLLLLPSIFPSIRVFCNESILCMRWPKYWSFSFSNSPSNEHLTDIL